MRWAIVALGGYALLGGVVSFLGWPLDVARLTDWFGTGVSIQPNTAVLIVLGGAALALLQLGRGRLAALLGGVIALAGGLNLLQYVIGADLGFNHQLLFGREWGQGTTVTPGRFGVPASASFLLIGASLLIQGLSLRGHGGAARARGAGVACGVGVCVFMAFSLMGYLFGAREFYSIPWLTAIALQTSSMLMALGIGLVASVPERQPMALLRADSSAGLMARSIVPVLVALPIIASWLKIEGERLALYDAGTGQALRILVVTAATVALMWLALLALQRREQRLHESEARYRTLIDIALHGIITIDEQGTIQMANPAAERLFGYSAAELVGKGIGVLMPDPHRREHGTYLENYQRTGERKVIGIGREVVGLRKDGSTFPMELAVAEFTRGGRRYFKGVVTDVTERRQIEAERRQRADDLAQALDARTAQVTAAERALAANQRMAAVGTMAAGLAHDIANLAVPLEERLEALLRGANLTGEQRGDLAVVVALVDHLRMMSRNLSLFARDPGQEGSVGTTELEPWFSRVQGLLEASLAGRASDRADRWVRLKHEIPADLPPVNVAPHRLSQAVLNVVHNARDAIADRCAREGPRAAEPGSITVAARLRGDGRAVLLSVADDGCGMTAEVAARATEPFFTTKDRPAVAGVTGSGMGLSLAHAICERAGGSLEIKSELGKGTTVVMTLPVAPRAEQPLRESGPPAKATVAGAP